MHTCWSGSTSPYAVHRILKSESKVWGVKRPEIVSSMPLNTIDVSESEIQDFSHILAIDDSGVIYVSSAEVRPHSERVIVLEAPVFGKFKNSDAEAMANFGYPFRGAVAASNTGLIYSISNFNEFQVVDKTSEIVLDIEMILKDKKFEVPEGCQPFWEQGACDLACYQDIFALAGLSMNRIDVYKVTGELLASLKFAKAGDQIIKFDRTNPLKISFDVAGRLWFSTTECVGVFDSEFRHAELHFFKQLSIQVPSLRFSHWFGTSQGHQIWGRGIDIEYYTCLSA